MRPVQGSNFFDGFFGSYSANYRAPPDNLSIRTQDMTSASYKLSALLICTLFCIASNAQQDASMLDIYRNSIYQIVVNENETGNKSALGSGFQVSSDGLIITNYHVVSGYVFEPNQRWLQYVDFEGKTGALELIDFDVINDVALLKAEGLGPDYFEISQSTYRKGDRIFAMGNPHDYGMLVVDGAYNGIAENSHIEKILFSGSLNSGMSGGPAVDLDGGIVGVNVATAGSQLSFLVPADKVVALIADQNRPKSTEEYMVHLSNQITGFQKQYYAELLAQTWPDQPLGENTHVVGELARDLSCWGSDNQNQPNADDIRVLELFCNNGNRTYLQNRFNTGQVHYSFYYYQTDTLTPKQFHDAVGEQAFHPDNQAPERYVTGFECQQNYVDIGDESDANGFRQAGLCFRAYKEFPGLYDVLYYLFQGRNNQALVSHFTLSAVTKDIALDFTKKFMDVARWT